MPRVIKTSARVKAAFRFSEVLNVKRETRSIPSLIREGIWVGINKEEFLTTLSCPSDTLSQERGILIRSRNKCAMTQQPDFLPSVSRELPPPRYLHLLIIVPYSPPLIFLFYYNIFTSKLQYSQ